MALPRSARLAAWGTAWLQGAGSLDDLLDAVRGTDEPHVVAGLPGPGGSPDVEQPLASALSRLRALGARALRLALPIPGDPLGLAGPPALTEAAVDAGEAVLAVGAPWALVPDVVSYGTEGDRATSVTWRAMPSTGLGAVPGLAEAERTIAEALREATDLLDMLDVAGASDRTVDALDALRSGTSPELPPSTGGRAVRLAATALRLRAVVDLATVDGGAVVSATQALRRADALRLVERASRRALVAAVGAALEPGSAPPSVRSRP